MRLSNIRWKALLALAFVWVAIYFNMNWIWGIIFLIWVIPEIKFGVAYFLEDVERSKNPITYWLIISSWILMSVLILFSSISKKLDPESPEFFAYNSAKIINCKSIGKYLKRDTSKTIIVTDSLRNESDSVKLLKEEKETVNFSSSDDVLEYRTLKSDELFIVGISTQTTFKDNKVSKDLEELWKYFIEYGVSYSIPGADESNIIVVYSDYNKQFKDYFTVTIGHQTKDTSNLDDGLVKVTVPAIEYAIFKAKENTENAIPELWEKVFDSDIKRKNDFDLEVYELGNKYEILNRELWISHEK